MPRAKHLRRPPASTPPVATLPENAARLRSATSGLFSRCSTIISVRQNALRRAVVINANQAVAWRKNPVNLTDAGNTGQSFDAFLASKNQAAQNATGCLGTPKQFMHRRKPIK